MGPTRKSSDERAQGQALRSLASRSSFGKWRPAPDRAHPLELLAAQNRTRLADLVPVRMGRMAQSPFSYLRGAAVVMAHDLAGLATTGVHVQACGDAHVANFGLFASPERALLFDVDDFDETVAASWELDVLRLGASAALAARDGGHGPAVESRAAVAAARCYRRHMAQYADMATLELWYARVDAEQALTMVRAPEAVSQLQAARRNTSRHVLPALTNLAPDGSRRIVDHPPLVTHEGVDEHGAMLAELMAAYRRSLADDRLVLLDRFTVVDLAAKAVGVGSVGTRCFIALLTGEAGDGLLLQVKEASRSVLSMATEPGAPGADGGQGHRVVDGQRLMQAASDIFLGWASVGGTDYYVRQLRDMKGSVDALVLGPGPLVAYAELCAWALARAHARSAGRGTAALISGYLGAGDVFDQSVGAFALTYADQTEHDHAELVKAIAQGRVPATEGT